MGRIKDGGGDDGDPVRSPLGWPAFGQPIGAAEVSEVDTARFGGTTYPARRVTKLSNNPSSHNASW